MFTGIVEVMGLVAAVEENDFGAVLTIDTQGWDHHAQAGESIAVNGCCLTVTENAEGGIDPKRLRFDVIRQTLDLTTLGGLRPGDGVNLEHAVRADQMLGGHIVQGHVDGVGEVIAVKKSTEEWRTRVRPPAHLMDYIVPQGSIAIDGVSLTVAALGDDWCEVALIPTTLDITTLGRTEVGAKVNLEADYVSKTVVHWLRRREEGAAIVEQGATGATAAG
ncbi:MAG: riboflavin synthase [Phycisphaerales bacterium]|nr:MAG: riboflavin synthase [Phycisphaerales bacterium]